MLHVQLIECILETYDGSYICGSLILDRQVDPLIWKQMSKRQLICNTNRIESLTNRINSVRFDRLRTLRSSITNHKFSRLKKTFIFSTQNSYFLYNGYRIKGEHPFPPILVPNFCKMRLLTISLKVRKRVEVQASDPNSEPK